jgi:KipI family sensor histidine kinase inhibitor
MVVNAPHIIRAGDSAYLVRFGQGIDPAINAQVLALLAALDADPLPGIIDLVPSYAALLVTFDPLRCPATRLIAHLRAAIAASFDAPPPATPCHITIPVAYGDTAGPDLAEVAHLLALTPAEVVRQHTAHTYRVYFLGFMAGFPYLGGLPETLRVPRLSSPRTHVPAGSVGLADAQTGIYPVASPGGWRIIGATTLRLFDPATQPPTLLRPGDEVRFVAIDNIDNQVQPRGTGRGQACGAERGQPRGAESGQPQGIAPTHTLGPIGVGARFIAPNDPSTAYAAIASVGATTCARPDSTPVRQPDDTNDARLPAIANEISSLPWLRVIASGPATTVQDVGRGGYARYGVSASGAADADALALGNALLGNSPDAAALECTLAGGSFEVLAYCVVALTAAACVAHADGVPVRWGIATALSAGTRLTLGAITDGARAYLCVAGGVAVPPVLGSRATDARAGLGGIDGRALQAGDMLTRGTAPRAFIHDGWHLPRAWQPCMPADGTWTVRILPGPHLPTLLATLSGRVFTVDPRSDRMGVRLRHAADAGEPPLPGGQVLSEGVPRGAIQVPPDGEPIILLADHQTTGGYRIPAVVASADLWQVAQMRPGDRVRFQPTTQRDALAALRKQAARISQVQAGQLDDTPPIARLMPGFSEWYEEDEG